MQLHKALLNRQILKNKQVQKKQRLAENCLNLILFKY